MNSKSKTTQLFNYFYAEGFGYQVLFSVIVALAIICMSRVCFCGQVYKTISDNYIGEFGIHALFEFFAVYIVVRIICPFIDRLAMNFFYSISERKELSITPKHFSIFCFVVLFICWTPYYLSYFPGGFFSDTFASIGYANSGYLNNTHPILYNLMIAIPCKMHTHFGVEANKAFGLFLAVQMLMIEIEFSFLAYWLGKHKLPKLICYIVMAFYIFFPLIPLYAISIWKDTVFAMAVLLWEVFSVDLFFYDDSSENNKGTLSGYFLGVFLVCFLRNNGIFAVAISTIVLAFVAKTSKKAVLTKITYLSFVVITVIALIQGPGYKAIGITQTDRVEALGVPLQQMASVVATDGVMTEEQEAFLDQVIPIEKIKIHYYPMVVDSLKWDAGLDYGFVAANMKQFFDVWFQLFVQNPVTYIKAYLMETVGFWDVLIESDDAYVQNFVWGNNLGIIQTDYFEKIFGFSFQSIVNPKHFFSAAWLFWVFFTAAMFIMKNFGWQKTFLFSPQISIWLTLMIAIPKAVGLRYVAGLLFTFPFAIIIPLFLIKEQKQNAKKIQSSSIDLS